MNEIRVPTITAEATVSLTPEAYERIFGLYGNHAASFTMERRTWSKKPRCLWGGTKRHIQVGTAEDGPTILTVNVPHATFGTA